MACFFYMPIKTIVMTTARSNRYFRARKKKAGKPESEPAYITMDMPEVKDIPGQEHIRPPRMQEMMDITASSADEEGEGILDDLNTGQNEDMLTDEATNVSGPERDALKNAGGVKTEEAKDRRGLRLDQTDGDTGLNEASDPEDMGKDLDVPGAELDDDDEAIGDEDEENNPYSLPD